MEASGHLNAPPTLSTGMSTLYILRRKLGGPHVWVSTMWERENFLVRSGIRTSSLGCSSGSFQLCMWENPCEVWVSCSNDDKISSLLGFTPCRL